MTDERAAKRQKAEDTAEKSTVLFSYWRSSCSWRVRTALNIKGIEFDYKPVNLLKSEQLEEAFAEKNPLFQLPVLCIDGHLLHESLAIIEYLEETRPEPPLLPKDPYERSVVRRLALMIAADIQPVQNLRVLKKQGSDRQEWARYWITNGFQALERELSSTAGRCCFGDEITVADICLIPQVYNAIRFNVDMSAFPTIVAVAGELEKHAAFKISHPSKQPDAVDA